MGGGESAHFGEHVQFRLGAAPCLTLARLSVPRQTLTPAAGKCSQGKRRWPKVGVAARTMDDAGADPARAAMSGGRDSWRGWPENSRPAAAARHCARGCPGRNRTYHAAVGASQTWARGGAGTSQIHQSIPPGASSRANGAAGPERRSAAARRAGRVERVGGKSGMPARGGRLSTLAAASCRISLGLRRLFTPVISKTKNAQRRGGPNIRQQLRHRLDVRHRGVPVAPAFSRPRSRRRHNRCSWSRLSRRATL